VVGFDNELLESRTSGANARCGEVTLIILPQGGAAEAVPFVVSFSPASKVRQAVRGRVQPGTSPLHK
jgi:hypothetical protein